MSQPQHLAMTPDDYLVREARPEFKWEFDGFQPVARVGSSVQRYVMLEQSRIFATIITRSPAGWGLALAGPGGTLAMPEIGIEVSMADLYDGPTFPPEGVAQGDETQDR